MSVYRHNHYILLHFSLELFYSSYDFNVLFTTDCIIYCIQLLYNKHDGERTGY